MKINFPITNNVDEMVCLMILEPTLFDFDYIPNEIKEKFFSLTEEEKEEIKNFINKGVVKK